MRDRSDEPRPRPVGVVDLPKMLECDQLCAEHAATDAQYRGGHLLLLIPSVGLLLFLLRERLPGPGALEEGVHVNKGLDSSPGSGGAASCPLHDARGPLHETAQRSMGRVSKLQRRSSGKRHRHVGARAEILRREPLEVVAGEVAEVASLTIHRAVRSHHSRGRGVLDGYLRPPHPDGLGQRVELLRPWDLFPSPPASASSAPFQDPNPAPFAPAVRQVSQGLLKVLCGHAPLDDEEGHVRDPDEGDVDVRLTRPHPRQHRLAELVDVVVIRDLQDDEPEARTSRLLPRWVGLQHLHAQVSHLNAGEGERHLSEVAVVLAAPRGVEVERVLLELVAEFGVITVPHVDLLHRGAEDLPEVMHQVRVPFRVHLHRVDALEGLGKFERVRPRAGGPIRDHLRVRLEDPYHAGEHLREGASRRAELRRLVQPQSLSFLEAQPREEHVDLRRSPLSP
mmetsp:Transcript_16291/g.40130  ORF Transcript_16291/g.40130 Transcript_16291/m.40130 type:complete len:452 (-) Transcript_16291:366-1721(-)